MYKVKLFNTPDKTWVDESRSCINLYAIEDLTFTKGQIGFIRFGDFRYDFDEEVLALPFVSKVNNANPLRLYYPKGFKLQKSGHISLAVDCRKISYDELCITKGAYLATLKLMTTQFYSLVSRKDGSDRGLRSAYIKIEFYDENNY